MIIAIDGPAGSGKSTTSRLVADRLGISYLDTGSMYRAITVHFIDNDYSIINDNIKSIMSSISLDISSSTNESYVFVNGKDITNRLRDNQVSMEVSAISSNKIIRKQMVAIQRSISENKSIVVDGRDIGTVVFPDADFKFYLTASIKERAQRRYNELIKQDKNKLSLDLIEKEIERRDMLDKSRENSPLKKAMDSIIIDTTYLNIDEQVNVILERINNNS